MSLYHICCGNFHQLRNSIGSSYTIRLLTYHNRLIYKAGLPTRGYTTGPASTTVLARSIRKESRQSFSTSGHLHSESVESSIEVFKESNLQRLKELECYNIQEKDSGIKMDCPATILVFDIETTGFKRNYQRIIEFAVRDLTGGKNSTFETLINPGIPIQNSEIHSITDKMVCKPDIPRFGDFIPILLQYVWSRQMAGKPVMFVAHNAKSFDVPFLMYEFRRWKAEMPDDWLFVDTLPIAKQLVDPDGKKLKSVALKSLGMHYNIEVKKDLHRAMQDVTLLSYVLQKLTFELKLTVPQLLEKSFRLSDIAK